MIREEGDRMQRSGLMVFRMAGSVLEVWQDAHRRGGLDEIGWGRGEDVGEAVSEGRREALGCSVLPPRWPGGRGRGRGATVLGPSDEVTGRCQAAVSAEMTHSFIIRPEPGLRDV